MRILHITDRLSCRGGADLHLLDNIDALARDHEVHLAAAVDDGTVVQRPPFTLVSGLDARTRQTVDLAPLWKTFQPDVVHLHNIMNPAVLEWASDRPSVMTLHDHRCFCPGRGKLTSRSEVCTQPMSQATCAGCFDDLDYFSLILGTTAERLGPVKRLPIIVLSDYMKRELQSVGVPEPSIHVIPPFVPERLARDPAVGSPCILFPGRLVEAKGVFDAMRAWHLSGLEVPLVFAGTGPLRNRIEQEGFKVTGWLAREQLYAYYQRSTAVIFSPRWQEPFGIVGLESLAAGTPVVAWKSGGIPEWHPGGELLVEWGDVAGLAEALRKAVVSRSEPPVGFLRETRRKRLVNLYREVCI